MTENKRYPGKARRKAAAVQFLKQHLIAKELETSVTEENGTTAVYGRDTSFLGLSKCDINALVLTEGKDLVVIIGDNVWKYAAGAGLVLSSLVPGAFMISLYTTAKYAFKYGEVGGALDKFMGVGAD